MVWWQFILFPFAILYDWITRWRNQWYDRGIFPSFEFDANVISVGNLSAGGTGKTPMVEYLTRYFLKQERNVAVLSRGYGRKTSGFRFATAQDTARTLGDEPLAYFQQFGKKAVVAVGEERVLAIPEILGAYPENEVIVLDDAFQHRPVQPGFSILLTTFDRPFYTDFVLPSGRLRENRSGVSRADVVVVTKCPQTMTHEQQQEIRQKIQALHAGMPVCFAGLKYQQLVPFFDGGKSERTKVLAVSALANDRLFLEFLQGEYTVVEHLSFADHHPFRERDVSRMVQWMEREGAMLVCTQKDAVKLSEFPVLKNYPCFYLPVEVVFLQGEEKFLDLMESSLKVYDRNYPAL
ncbi:MAG: tetraacyldisaccharide 4'-kinase [Cyclobacteriaceae bacterium]|nr:tetraacyldisaccharide 4'-kinase [Cyclobacteriaceae bacterium]